MAPSLVAIPPPPCRHLIPVVALLLLLLTSINSTDAQTGVCYGTQGTSLPSPQATVSLFKQNNIRRVRIYGPNPDILRALSGSGIEVMLGVPNADLPRLAASQSNAAAWLQQNVQSYPNVAFRYIVVGNEVRPNNHNSPFAQSLLPALQNVQDQVRVAGLGGHIKVSTAFDYGVLGVSHPPSAGRLDDGIASFLGPVVSYIASTGAPLMFNVFPYLAYARSSGVRLDYALFTAPGTVVADPEPGGLQYQNLFDAMVDAVCSALERAGAGSIAVVVAETGWPTAGGKGATVENARAYNNNLVNSVRDGTPKRRGREMETYIFAMYNENRKSQELEKHWGLYNNFSPMYSVHF